MGHPPRLPRLPLPTGNEAVPAARGPIGNPVAAVPEFRGDPMIDHVPQHVSPSAVFNQPERIAAELEIVAALIDAIGPMAFDIDAALHVFDQLIARCLTRFEPDIGDT